MCVFARNEQTILSVCESSSKSPSRACVCALFCCAQLKLGLAPTPHMRKLLMRSNQGRQILNDIATYGKYGRYQPQNAVPVLSQESVIIIESNSEGSEPASESDGSDEGSDEDLDEGDAPIDSMDLG